MPACFGYIKENRKVCLANVRFIAIGLFIIL